MPRRTSARTVTSSATPQTPVTPQLLETPYDSNIRHLRRHWKWAAFSQFFFTFSPLLAMSDVTLVDVENDLVHSTNMVLSRVMQRLLITLTQDRKISAESWQNALRRQYQRRDPDACPIGLLSRSQRFAVESSRASTAPPGTLTEAHPDEPRDENEPQERDQSRSLPFPGNAEDMAHVEGEDLGHTTIVKVEEEDGFSDASEAPEKQVDWLDLPMLTKLESLHTLAEWQFQNPNRLRQQMKTDDELATWRIEPIGYDARRNAYWLIGSDRLWIQREPPRPNLKRKRKPDGNGRAQTQSQAVKRQRIALNLGVSGQSSIMRPTRSKTCTQPLSSPREGRAAKARANQRLDAQARDLAEFRRQMVTPRTRTASVSPRKSTGTRVSARLRGTAVDDDEWQEVPDEWLAASNPSSDPLSSSKREIKTGLESDNGSISELTELSDGDDVVNGTERDSDETSEAEKANPTFTEKHIGVVAKDQQAESAKIVDPPLHGDFVEWETICVTLDEWEIIGHQFEKATHYAEKALHKVLSQTIVPMVTTELQEVEKKRRMEEAVVHRKRSSRIAMKEIEKEERRAVMRKRAEEEEKTSRARRLEARLQKEEAERVKRENAREQRRKERELREEQSAETLEAESKPDVSVDVVEEETGANSHIARQGKAPVVLSTIPVNGMVGGSRSPAENWELDCEVCGQKGINQDAGLPLLCCSLCGKWQHISCHDKQDIVVGHPKRNWDAEDFICRHCHPMTCKTSSSTPDLRSPIANIERGQASGTPAHYSQIHYSRTYPDSGCHQNLSSNPRYPYNHPDIQTATARPYTSQTQSTGVTFAHYQPQQGGFSTSRPTYSAQDVNTPHHASYTISPHTVSTTGVTPYPSTFHTQAMTPPVHLHEQWHPSSSYPRTSSYPVNGGPPVHVQGIQPYYNGHARTSYSHMRGTTNPAVLEQYAGLQHVPSYQHSK